MGYLGYSVAKGRRDFTSASQVVARRYDVLCQPGRRAGPDSADGLGQRDLLRPGWRSGQRKADARSTSHDTENSDQSPAPG